MPRRRSAFHLRLDMSITPDADVAKVLYPGTESLAATFHMASPLRLEAVHRTRVDEPSTETVLQWYLVDAPSQASVRNYHDYLIRFERPLPDFVGFKIYWFGRAYCSVWVDQIRLLEEPLPSEAAALKDTQAESIKVDHTTPATLVWAGPYNWTYRISPLLSDLLPVTTTGLSDVHQAPPGGWVVKLASDRFKQLK